MISLELFLLVAVSFTGFLLLSLLALLQERRCRYEHKIVAENEFHRRSEWMEENKRLAEELREVKSRLRKHLEIELGRT